MSELLSFARPFRLNPVFFDLARLLSLQLDLFERKFKKKELTALREIDPRLPMIWADQEMLGQVMVSVLKNAVELADPFTRITVRYDLTYKGNTGFVSLGVDTEGQTLNRTRREALFSPASGTTLGRTGFGLVNVKRIIEAHHGAIFVENRKRSKGVSFFITIPTKIMVGT